MRFLYSLSCAHWHDTTARNTGSDKSISSVVYISSFRFMRRDSNDLKAHYVFFGSGSRISQRETPPSIVGILDENRYHIFICDPVCSYLTLHLNETNRPLLASFRKAGAAKLTQKNVEIRLRCVHLSFNLYWWSKLLYWWPLQLFVNGSDGPPNRSPFMF